MFEVFAVDRLAYKFERNRVLGQMTAKWFLYAWAAHKFLAKCGDATADYRVEIRQFGMLFSQPKNSKWETLST